MAMSGNDERMGAADDGKSAGGRGTRGRAQVDPRLLADREAAERDFTEDRDLSEDERLELFRESLVQSVLPDLPRMPGFHTCWLTTSNPRDSIQWRIRIGYELVKVQDCPGWDGVTVAAGDYAGVIAVNEMVAARIPLGLYNRYMREVHHTLPLKEEEKLRSQIDEFAGAAERRGSRVIEGDGTAELVQRAKPMPLLDA
jgi:hypothetical protein